MRSRVTTALTPTRLDLGLAGVLALAALADATAAEVPSEQRFAFALCLLAVTAALALRRSRPTAVALTGAIGLIAATLVVDDPESVTLLFAIVVASYSQGAYEERTPYALAGLGALVVAVAVSILSDPTDTAGNIAPTVLLFVILPGIAGRALHRRGLDARHADERSVRLAADRDAAAARAVAQERTRIARELHDVVAHAISVIAVQAGAAEAALDIDPQRARGPLVSTQRTAHEALEEMRRLVGMLRDDEQAASLRPPPGLADVPDLVRDLAPGLRASLSVDGVPVRLPPGQDLAGYRIIQEALTNARKHGAATEASVTIRYRPGALELSIVDRGTVTPASGWNGRGLAGMRERVALYAGTLHAAPRDAGGFEVHAVLPTHDADPDR